MCLDLECSTRWHRLHAVVDEIDEELNKLGGVSEDVRKTLRTRERDSDRLFERSRTLKSNDIGEQWLQRDDPELSVLTGRHEAKPVCQANNPRYLHRKQPRRRVSIFWITEPVWQHRDEVRNRRKGTANFMSDASVELSH